MAFLMNQSPAAESAIREKLSAYTDPYLARLWRSEG